MYCIMLPFNEQTYPNWVLVKMAVWITKTTENMEKNNVVVFRFEQFTFLGVHFLCWYLPGGKLFSGTNILNQWQLERTDKKVNLYHDTLWSGELFCHIFSP